MTCENGHLRILATSDLHMHLEPFDYYAEEPCANVGLALTATLIAQARGEVKNHILLDNGDFLQGSPLGEYLSQSGCEKNPMIQAMNHLRYDAGNLGNHEFSHGLPFLHQAIGQTEFPVVSANVINREHGNASAPLLPPYTLLDRHICMENGKSRPIRIGVVGVLPPQTEMWEKQTLQDQIETAGIVPSLRERLPEIRAAGADIIVALAHCGIGDGSDDPEGENAGLAIAKLEDVDVVIMGHLHLPFPGATAEPAPAPGVDHKTGKLHGKPAVMPGAFGSHLGVIDLSLSYDRGHWRVQDHTVQNRPISQREARGRLRAKVQPDHVVSQLVAPHHRRAIEWARQPIGESHIPLHSYFAMVRDCPSVRVVNQAQTEYVVEKLADTPLSGLPVLSAASPFKSGGHIGPENFCHIPPGNLVMRHAANLYLHPNTITALHLTGAEVKAWLERAAQCFMQLRRGAQDQILLNADVPPGMFDVISGLTYEIDLTARPNPENPEQANRIRNLRCQGAPLEPKAGLILATNNFRASGGGGFFKGDPDRIALSHRRSVRSILTRNLARRPLTRDFLQQPATWKFSPVAGATALFETAPGAKEYLHEFAPNVMTPLGINTRGFEVMRLALAN